MITTICSKFKKALITFAPVQQTSVKFWYYIWIIFGIAILSYTIFLFCERQKYQQNPPIRSYATNLGVIKIPQITVCAESKYFRIASDSSGNPNLRDWLPCTFGNNFTQMNICSVSFQNISEQLPLFFDSLTCISFKNATFSTQNDFMVMDFSLLNLTEYDRSTPSTLSMLYYRVYDTDDFDYNSDFDDILPISALFYINLHISMEIKLNGARRMRYEITQSYSDMPAIFDNSDQEISLKLRASSFLIPVYEEYNPTDYLFILTSLGSAYTVIKAIDALLFLTDIKSRFIFDKHAKKRDDFIDNTQYKLMTEEQNS